MAALIEQKMHEDNAERTWVQYFPAHNSSLLDIARVDLSRQYVLSANPRIETLRVGMAVYNRILRAVRSFSDVTCMD